MMKKIRMMMSRDWVGHLSKPSDPGPEYPSERVAGRTQLPDNRSKKPTKDA